MRRIGIEVAVMIGASLAPAFAHSQDGTAWSGSLTPYLWMPSVDTTLHYAPASGSGGAHIEVEAKPHDYLKNLNFAFMIAGEARNGRLSLFSDLVYLDMRAEDSAVRAVDFGGGALPVDTSLNANTRTKLNGFAWSALGGYSLASSPESPLDVFAGVRYLGLKAETGWQLATVVQGPGAGQTFERSGSVSQRVDLWDGVVGLRGRFRTADGHWTFPYYADVGTGSSRLTWQLMAGVTYVLKWGDVGLMYRHLSYEQTGDKLLSHLTMGGPALGATFHF